MVRSAARAFCSSSTTRMRHLDMIGPANSNLHAARERGKTRPPAHPLRSLEVIAQNLRCTARRPRLDPGSPFAPVMGMKRILVGLDGSPESRRAADQAAELARSLDARLLLAYVVSLPAALGPEPIELTGWEIAERAHARDLLEELSGHYREQGIGIETAMPSGPPAETLADMALPDDV